MIQAVTSLDLIVEGHHQPFKGSPTRRMARYYMGDGHPTFNDGNPYNGYINPFNWWPSPTISPNISGT